MAMGACPGQIPMPCVPPALMVTATMVRACRYRPWRDVVASIVTLVHDGNSERVQVDCSTLDSRVTP